MIGENVYSFTVFKLLESAFVKLPRPWYDLIINPPCRTAHPLSLPQNFFSLICHEKQFLEKGPPYFRGGTPFPLLHWKIMWGCVPSVFATKWIKTY